MSDVQTVLNDMYEWLNAKETQPEFIKTFK